MVRHTSLSSPLERTCRSSMVRSLGTVVVAWLHVCSALTLARVGLSVIYTDLLSIIIICILIRNIATSSFWLLCYCYAVVCVFSPNYRPCGLLLWKSGRGIFNVRKYLNACCAHEGEADTGDYTQMFTWKNWRGEKNSPSVGCVQDPKPKSLHQQSSTSS